MKNRIILLLSLLTIFFTSCHSGLIIPREERVVNLMKFPEAINGIYSNNPVDSLKGNQYPFWAHLKPFFKNKVTNLLQIKPSDLKVEIKIEDKSNIRFSLLKAKEVISSNIFKYDIVDDQIRIKNNSSRNGIPLLFYQHHKEVIILSLNKESDLIATFDGAYSGGVFIIIFGGKIKNKSIYKKS